jgi:hypothetical protein
VGGESERRMEGEKEREIGIFIFFIIIIIIKNVPGLLEAYAAPVTEKIIIRTRW